MQRSGKPLKRYLARSDPFRSLNCDGEECHMCKISPTSNCKTRDAAYKIKFTCGENDIGETAHRLGERCHKHIEKLKRKKSTTVFHQHMIEKHSGTEQALSIHLLGTCPNDAMLRQVTEATYIHTKNLGWNAKAPFTLYRIAIVAPQLSHQIGVLFTSHLSERINDAPQIGARITSLCR